MFKIEGTHVDVARKEYTPLIKVGWCVSCCRCNYLSIVLLEKINKILSIAFKSTTIHLCQFTKLK